MGCARGNSRIKFLTNLLDTDPSVRPYVTTAPQTTRHPFPYAPDNSRAPLGTTQLLIKRTEQLNRARTAHGQHCDEQSQTVEKCTPFATARSGTHKTIYCHKLRRKARTTPPAMLHDSATCSIAILPKAWHVVSAECGPVELHIDCGLAARDSMGLSDGMRSRVHARSAGQADRGPRPVGQMRTFMCNGSP